MDFLMRLLAAFERQIEFSYTESAIKKQFASSQSVQTGSLVLVTKGEKSESESERK